MKLTIVILAAVLVIAVNYSPIIYYRVSNPVGTWAEFYNFKEMDFKTLKHKIDSAPLLKIVTQPSKEYEDYYRIVFYNSDRKRYFYTQVLCDTVNFDSYTQIILTHVCSELNEKKVTVVNKGFGIIQNYFLIKDLETNILSKIYNKKTD